MSGPAGRSDGDAVFLRIKTMATPGPHNAPTTSETGKRQTRDSGLRNFHRKIGKPVTK